MNILQLYNNYLHAIDYEEQYGNKYGDNASILRMYEKMLLEYKIKIITKDGKCEEEKVKVKKWNYMKYQKIKM